MPTSAIRRFCFLTLLIIAVQIALPAYAQAWDPWGWISDHAVAIVTAVAVAAVVAVATAAVIATAGLAAPLVVPLAVGAVTGLAAGVWVDHVLNQPPGAGTPPGAAVGTPPGSGVGVTIAEIPETGTPVGTVPGTAPGTVPGTAPGSGPNTLALLNTTQGGGPNKSGGPGDKDGKGGGGDPNFQNDDSKSRWGLRGPNTPFFSGSPVGKDQGTFNPGDGFKGGSKLPDASNVKAGCVTDPRTGKCMGGSNPLAAKGDYAAKSPSGMLETMGGVGSRGSGGGSPSLGSMLTGADKPAGFQEFEKRAAADVNAQALGPEGAPSPGEEPPPEASLPNDGMNLDKKVPVMGETAAPGDEEQRKAAELLDKAKAKISARDYQGAIEDLTEAIKLAPKNPLLYVTRAVAYNLSGNYAAAEKDALASIALDPENPEAWVNLAWAQMKQGKLKEALDSATRALRLDPKNAFAYAIRAFLREKLGDDKGKMDDIKRAAALDSRFLPFYQRGMRGQQIYDPNADYSPFFLHRGRPAQRPGGPMWPVYLGLGLLLLSAATAGALAYFYREGRKKGSVKNFQEFLAAFKQH